MSQRLSGRIKTYQDAFDSYRFIDSHGVHREFNFITLVYGPDAQRCHVPPGAQRERPVFCLFRVRDGQGI